MYSVEAIRNEAAAGNSFAASLLQQFNQYQGLTRRQIEALQRGKPQAPAPVQPLPVQQAWHPQAPAARPAAGRFAPLVQAFAKAQEGGKRFKLRIGTYTFTLARDGVSIAVFQETGYPGGKYLGKFTQAGEYESWRRESIGDKLAWIAQHPTEAAVQHGKETGSCSVCSRTLTDPESVARGIGPVCAERMGWAA